ncbi:MAG: FkbM family methyltransferase [Acetobacteraceae bacterium]|nr:FkbM family methyltransferase [Acetobacteraceae bacterium]MDW8397045.1 FkbM family methyltransferase [Acetobacteraceae bacterium]
MPAAPNAAAPLPDSNTLLATLIDRVEALAAAVRVLSLGPERVFAFAESDTLVRMHLPFAERDAIQRAVLRSGGFYEARQLADIRALIRPGAVVVDAGANIGNHTLYFALVCRAAMVHAIEPGRVAGAILRRNVALNALEERVRLHELALGAAPGRASFVRYGAGNIGAATLGPDAGGTYPVAPLDSLGLERVDFLKMDVEGGFVDALRGAAETLRRLRPPVWIELRPKFGELEPGVRALGELGYRLARRIGNSPNDHLFLPE